jgi:hypothetical protein
MKSPGILERLDDALNPIVVKELRQAVHSRFVSAVLLFFLVIQLLYIGIHLMFVAAGGQVESIEFQAGREVFTALQVILLATCMLFLPLYTGIRLAAERNEANTDLLFITTLRPWSIISGKLISAVVIALLIFSACTPFMAFTYFLRGIDWTSIILIITGDFLVVIASVQIMVFLAVVPANRLFKAFLGLVGFGILVWIFGWTLGASILLLWEGGFMMADRAAFWVGCGMTALGIVGIGGLFFSWSVALVSPPSSNRALPVRLYMLGFLLVSGALAWWASAYLASDGPFTMWVIVMFILGSISLMIAINERETWTPRMARAIPRPWWARPFAFFFFSGAAGGVLFSGLLFGLTVLAVYVFRDVRGPGGGPFGMPWDLLMDTYRIMGTMALYLGCYALTAVFVRTWLFRSVPAGFTWIIMVVLVAAGSLLPFLFSFFAFYREWRYDTHYIWLLGNPGAAMVEMAMGARSRVADVYVHFAAVWAAAITLLNVPWFFRQMRGFRPPAENGGAPVGVAVPSAMTAVPLDSTQTAPSA